MLMVNNVTYPLLGIEILMTWLGRGDCNKRNCGAFYSMIQAANTHVKRLLTDQVPTGVDKNNRYIL